MYLADSIRSSKSVPTRKISLSQALGMVGNNSDYTHYVERLSCIEGSKKRNNKIKQTYFTFIFLVENLPENLFRFIIVLHLQEELGQVMPMTYGFHNSSYEYINYRYCIASMIIILTMW